MESVLEKHGLRFLPKCITPISCGYRPEIDVTGELKTDGVQCYQEMIANLGQAVEIGRIDILLEVSLISTHLAIPQEGNI